MNPTATPLPFAVQSRLQYWQSRLYVATQALENGCNADLRFGGCGRYEADAWRNVAGEIIYDLLNFQIEFKILAAQNGHDGEAILAEYAIDKAPTLSEQAQKWLAE